jgi:hypothetical protein
MAYHVQLSLLFYRKDKHVEEDLQFQVAKMIGPVAEIVVDSSDLCAVQSELTWLLRLTDLAISFFWPKWQR